MRQNRKSVFVWFCHKQPYITLSCCTSNSSSSMEIFDLQKQFAFYGAYHSNKINIAIHMIFVWPILFSMLIILYFCPSLINISLFDSQLILRFNIGFLLTLIYSVFYVRFDFKAGSLAALLCFLSWLGSSFITTQLGFPLSWKIVLVVQLVCWIGQFVGHGVFEKRAPALLDNLLQAFLMAPFFVLLEALQTLFGYEPYPGFHAGVQAKIEAEVNEFQEKKQQLLH